jgi:sarcosine oxidase, subunit gamma
MDDTFTRAPLSDRSDHLARISARVVPHLTQIDLRLDPSDAGRSPYPLPIEPNTSSSSHEVDVIWLGPDEWLLVGARGTTPEITSRLESALSDIARSTVDVSANRVAIDLAGDDRLELLSHVCRFDLAPPGWVAGRCAQTLAGRAEVLLHERQGTTRLFVRPSFAGYLLDLLDEVRRVTGDMRA